VLDATRADERSELAQRLHERDRLRARLPVHGIDTQDVGLAVEQGVDAPDQPVAAQDRQ
jgi:hypothetical protein